MLATVDLIRDDRTIYDSQTIDFYKYRQYKNRNTVLFVMSKELCVIVAVRVNGTVIPLDKFLRLFPGIVPSFSKKSLVIVPEILEGDLE